MTRVAAESVNPQAGAGAQERFAALLEGHAGILLKISRAYARSVPDRQDLSQEIAAQLWRSFPRYDDRLPFSTWMYRVGLNVAISFVRRQTVRARHFADPDAAEGVPDPAGGAAGNRELHLLERFLAGLGELDRALMLLYLDGRPHDAIAEVLGISRSNVGTRVSRLKERLRRDLDAHAV
jgi:RNA polymerase sigma-70 factor (ECF subfamily)